MSDSIPSPAVPQDFPSYEALRLAHTELLRQHRQAADPNAVLPEIEAFLARAQATGARLDDESERQSAQSLLDYWTTSLFRLGQEAPPRILAEFDAKASPDIPDELCPYRGLSAFGENDSPNFFGRQKMVADLVEHLRTSRLLGVMGSSGSGKSSVVRAGVIPALKNGALPDSQDWAYLPSFVPGSKPLLNLARVLRPENAGPEWDMPQSIAFLSDPDALVRLADERFARPLVLVVDQFEEAFTLCENSTERAAFVTNLVNLVVHGGTDQSYRHTLIITMRTDFEPKLALLGEFQALIENNIFRVPSLNAGELRQAIEEPARRVGLKFEAGVVDALINDILGEPAALPLLQFTLLKLWEARRHNLVTWESFKHLGGARQALSTSADEFYRSLIPEEQAAARAILLRLVQPGEGLEMTSRRLRREDLYTGNFARERVDRVLQRFLDERLLRLTQGDRPQDDQIEVAHEALIRNWPTLAHWYQEELEEIKERRRVTTATDNWERLNHDPAALLRGRPLELARKYTDLTRAEQAFVDASWQAEQAAQERELRRSRALRAIAIIASVAAVIAIAASIIAGGSLNVTRQALSTSNQRGTEVAYQAATATVAQGAAEYSAATATAALVSALEEKAIADQQRATAAAALAQYQAQKVAADQAQQLASQKDLVAQSQSIANTQLDLGLLLALEASSQESILLPGADPESNLLQVLRTNPRLLTFLRSDPASINSLAFSPDGAQIIAGNDGGQLQYWDTQTRTLQKNVRVFQGPVLTLAIAPNGRMAVGGCANSENVTGTCLQAGASLASLDNPNFTTPLYGHSSPVSNMAFSPDSLWLAAASNDSLTLWSGDPPELADALPGVRAIAINPRGNQIARAMGNDISLDNLRSLAAARLSTGDVGGSMLSGEHTAPVSALAYSPDGNYLASGGEDNLVVLWDLTGRNKPLRLARHTFTINSLAFSPDNRFLASASGDGTLVLWLLNDIINSGADPSLASEVLAGHNDAVLTAAFSPDSSLLASGGRDGAIILWNTGEPLQMGRVFPWQNSSAVNALAFTRKEDTLSVARQDLTLQNWDISAALNSKVAAWSPLGDASALPFNTQAVFFSPRGQVMVLVPEEVIGALSPRNDPRVNWLDAPQGLLSFAYINIADGPIPDPYFYSHWQSAARPGLLRSIYIRYRPGISPDELINLIDRQLMTVGAAGHGSLHLGLVPQYGFPALRPGAALGLELPVAVLVDDLQNTDPQIILQELSVLLFALGSYYGPPPLVYTSASVWNRLASLDVTQSFIPIHPIIPVTGGEQATNYPLLVTDYTDADSPSLPSGWSDWTLWEFSPADGTYPGQEALKLPLLRFNGSQDALASLADNLMSGNPLDLGRKASLVDLTSGKHTTGLFPFSPNTPSALAPDGKTIWIASNIETGVLDQVDLKSGKIITSHPFAPGRITSLAFSPDGRTLAIGSENTQVTLVDVIRMKEISLLSGHTGAVLSLAFSPDSARLASGGADSTILLWDLDQKSFTGKPFIGHRSAVTALAFHPTGKYLVSGSADGNVILWEIDPTAWRTLACERAGRNLSLAEFAKYFPNDLYRKTCPQYPNGK